MKKGRILVVHRENMENREKEREEAEAMDLLAQAADECARQDQEEEEKNDDEVFVFVSLPKQRYGGAHKRHWPLPVRVHVLIIFFMKRYWRTSYRDGRL